MMYVEMTKDLEVNLMGMSWEEAVALLRMIEGAGLQERRNQLLREYAFYNQQYCGCEFSMRHLQKITETI